MGRSGGLRADFSHLIIAPEEEIQREFLDASRGARDVGTAQHRSVDTAIGELVQGVDSRAMTSCAASSKDSRPPATQREGCILCASSLCCAPGAIVAWVGGLRIFATISILQVGLSVNFWRRPEWGWRRTLDIACALLLTVAVMGHWSSREQCAFSGAVRLGYTACFLLWSRATTSWMAKRATWVWWHASFHALLGVMNLVLVWGFGLLESRA